MVFYTEEAPKIMTAPPELRFFFLKGSQQVICRVQEYSHVFLSCPVAAGLWMLLLEGLYHSETLWVACQCPRPCSLHYSRAVVEVLSFQWLCLCNLEIWSKSGRQGWCCRWGSPGWAVSSTVTGCPRALLSLCICRAADGLVSRL